MACSVWRLDIEQGSGGILKRFWAGWIIGDRSPVRFFSPLAFSTTWPGSFLGSFWVRFFHRNVFSTTSWLRFWVRFGSFFGADHLFSVTSWVRFLK